MTATTTTDKHTRTRKATKARRRAQVPAGVSRPAQQQHRTRTPSSSLARRAPLPANARTNEEVALAFDEIAELLELAGGANPFRVRAYRTAAQRVREQQRGVADRLRAGEDLSELPSIGKDLAGKIDDVVRTGTTALLEELRAQIPAGLRELLRLPGLGPRRVQALHQQLGVDSVDGLRRALDDDKVSALRGFGEKTAERLRAALAHAMPPATAGGPAPPERRFLLDAASSFADDVVRWLHGARGVRHVVVAGSYRRAKETVGDLDVLATGDEPQAIIERFVRYRDAHNVTAQGSTRAAIELESGMQIDLRVVDEHSFGAALHYFTGNKAHNIAVRTLGRARGLKINEYGVFRGNKRVAGATEESVFAAVGLPFIEPELREDRGELDAARARKLPQALVRLEDLRGDLHTHTRRTDGTATVEEMVEGARAHGLDYLAVTDHSRRLAVTGGVDARGLRAEARAIEKLANIAARLDGFTVLTGVEVDILEDGRLDLPEQVLLEVDVVIASVHSAFDLPRDKQTARLLRAMDHRAVGILGHPTGRLLGRRAPMDFDVERVIAHAQQRGTVLELNAQPERLDLADVHCRLAKERGVLVSIASDAHSASAFSDLRFGVGQARRGWLERGDVLNTRSAVDVRRLLRALR